MPQRLMVFSGLPGTGKSALAAATGRELHTPVFSKDYLEAALWRSGIPRELKSGWASYELLTTLAEGQLRLGQSAILDSVASTESIRQQWRELSIKHHASFVAIECVCSDEALHRARIESRQRGIPGWYELDWGEVERVRSYYAPWRTERLVVDSVRPLEENVAAVLAYLKK
jgi:predicted kinase